MGSPAVIDHVTTLLSPAGRADPYPVYRALHAHGPVLPVGPQYVAVVGYAEADAVLRDPGFVVEDAARHDAVWPQWREHPALVAFINSMLFTNSPRHERLRQLVSRSFTPRRVAGMAPSVERLAAALCDRMAEQGRAGGPVDFMAEFAFLLPVNVIGDLLGVPEDDRPWFRPLVGALSSVLEMSQTEDELATANAAVQQLDEYFLALVAERRRHPSGDLVSDLVRAQDGGQHSDGDRLSDAELLANLVLLLAAGFETTTNLLGNGLAVLLAEPSVRASVAARPALAEAFVEEVLRFDSPVQLTSRLAERPARVGDVDVAAGTSVLLLTGAANRDPRRFADPDRFDPARPDNQPLSFGAGPHFCLGAALARLEARTAFPMLLERFPDLTAAGPATRRDRLTLRGYAGLPVTV